jgi:8-oxo-dGTP pyrophosphatase MutT (NUDIX family)
MNRDVLITRVATVEGRSAPVDWPWAAQNRDAIEANWERRKAEKPRMFNGRVLMVRDLDLSDAACRMVYSEVDFKDFLGWLDLGQPDGSIANGFAAGALQGSDGAFICGVMAEHTANAGRVYFAAGTPDRSDLLPDGSIDLAGSLERELFEETGLSGDAYTVHAPWIVIRAWPAIALVRYVVLKETADAAAQRIRAHLAASPEPELADVRIIRATEDIDPRTMPQYVQHFFRWHFAQR